MRREEGPVGPRSGPAFPGDGVLPAGSPREAPRPRRPRRTGRSRPGAGSKCGVFDPGGGRAGGWPRSSRCRKPGLPRRPVRRPRDGRAPGKALGRAQVLAYLPTYAYVVRGAGRPELCALPGVRYAASSSPPTRSLQSSPSPARRGPCGPGLRPAGPAPRRGEAPGARRLHRARRPAHDTGPGAGRAGACHRPHPRGPVGRASTTRPSFENNAAPR